MNPDLILMPFQEVASDWLAKTRHAMLVHDPGVGKTPTAVRACVKAHAERVLVFAPPIGMGVWRTHFQDWSDYKSVRVMNTDYALVPFSFMRGPGVRIVPYSRCRPKMGVINAAMSEEPWDVIIIDETHYLKNPDAQRTRAIYGPKIDLAGTPCEHATRVWCLTGTPLLNHPAEFWTHLHALKPDLIILPQFGVMTYDVFVARFCVTQTTPQGARILGGKNAHELALRIAPFIDRKRIRDVLTDLPDLRIVEHALPADTKIDPTLRAEIDQATSEFTSGAELDDDQLLATVQAGNVAFSTTRRLIGRAKVPGVAALVTDMLEDAQDSKVILFAHHREVIVDLTTTLKAYNPLVIVGATPLKVREQYVAQFQNNPARRLIILSIEAASEVITLHASHDVVLAEPSPVPDRNKQAIARAFRKGQKHPVLARFVLLPGTLDARLMTIIARKTRDIARVVDGVVAPDIKPDVGLDFPDTI